MKRRTKHILLFAASMAPLTVFAQGPTEGTYDLRGLMDRVYEETMPLCSQLISVARGLAAFAAIWYIGSRVWRSIASAEPIDFYPLLRPFVIAIAIALFPQVIQLMNGVLQPTVRGTELMIENSNKTMEVLLKRKEDAIKKARSYALYGEDGSFMEEYILPGTKEENDDPFNVGLMFMINKAAFNFKAAINQWMAEVLQVLYEAAALCINTVRVFYLVVLAIIGPIVFGLAVFDGFQNSLIAWFGRYINVFLWLPVANIFSSILGRLQESMIKLDIEQIELHGDPVFGLYDTAYMIFLIIGIVGYLFVPSIANYIVHAGDNRHVARTTSFAYSLIQSGYEQASKYFGGHSSTNAQSGRTSGGRTVLMPIQGDAPGAGSAGVGTRYSGDRNDNTDSGWRQDRIGKS